MCRDPPRSDGVATITLTAPQRRNALTRAIARALANACDEIEADRSISAVVVQGRAATSAQAAIARF